MRQEQPILIIGAGATGLILACVLARHGARFRIIDKLSEIRPHARAIAVHSRTLEVFQDLGLVDAIVERGRSCATSKGGCTRAMARAPGEAISSGPTAMSAGAAATPR